MMLLDSDIVEAEFQQSERERGLTPEQQDEAFHTYVQCPHCPVKVLDLHDHIWMSHPGEY